MDAFDYISSIIDFSFKLGNIYRLLKEERTKDITILLILIAFVIVSYLYESKKGK